MEWEEDRAMCLRNSHFNRIVILVKGLCTTNTLTFTLLHPLMLK